MCIPQGYTLHHVQYTVGKFTIYFDDRILLMESASQIERTVHVFVYGLNSFRNRFCFHYFRDSCVAWHSEMAYCYRG
jgi:hypothetical protein